jgi:precorrin-2 dehydrogenase / sirohydrochlorin ferrochelatase
MEFYPIFINMKGRLAVVIGGGAVAERKIGDLIVTGAAVRVISPDITDGISEIKKVFPDRVDIISRKYTKGDLDGAYLAFSATNNSAVNREIFSEAEGKNIPINAVDDPDNCSFIIPSSLQRGDLIISVSTGGASPSMSAKIRRNIEKSIPADIDKQLVALREARLILKNDPSFNCVSAKDRGELMKKITNDEVLLNGLAESFERDELSDFLKGIK